MTLGPVFIAGAVVALLAALVHVMIFAFESVLWSRPTVWKRFGLRTQDEAETTKALAYNQGFYNLFLTIGTVVGFVLVLSGAVVQAGVAVILFAQGSMLLASLVLVTSNPKLARAAATQGALPLIAIVLMALGLAL